MTSLNLEETVEFADNPEPRCPCVLLLDTSGSMGGEPIAALNEGLRVFKEEIAKDALASRRVDVAVVTFDSQVRVVREFSTADRFDPPQLTAQGLTHMGEAIQCALDMVTARKATYHAAGLAHYRPWLFMITDGAPQGEPEGAIAEAARRIREEEDARRIAFFAVGVENADMARLTSIATRAPVKLKGLDFREMFVWLSASMQRVSQSKTGDQVALPPPGWGAI